MINIKNKDACCGCTACEHICPQQCITMKPDLLGFLYPEADPLRCIDCGLCESVCMFHENYAKDQNLPQLIAYAVRHKDIREIETSRSGAAFIALSDFVLRQGGVVYGAGYADGFRVVHKRATNRIERDEFKGSKYVQSDLNTVFRQVKDDLTNGIPVLFSGTPCQTSGLNSFVGKRLKNNLFLIDIICHGAPSPYIWRDYLSYMEMKAGQKITDVNFRDKKVFGWKAHIESFGYEKEYYRYSSTFSYLFYEHIMFRFSCGVCPFANLQRPSDITLGDYWGWEKTHSSFNADNKGCSLILLNTPKGKEWFEEVVSDLNVIPAQLENIMQPNLQHPTLVHRKRRMNLERDYANKGMGYVLVKYGNKGWRYRLKSCIRKYGSIIKRLILRK